MTVDHPGNAAILSRLPVSDDGRPPLLLVHGAMCGPWVWEQFWMPALVQAGWACHAVDLHPPVNGRTPRWSTLGDYRRRVINAALALPRPPVLIGHSLGSRVALEAAKESHAVGLVLLAGVGVTRNLRIFQKLAKRSLRDALLVALGQVRQGLSRPEYLFGPDMPQDQIKTQLNRLEWESPLTMYQTVLPVSAASLPQPPLPSLVLIAEHDGLIPRGLQERTAQRLNATVHVLAGSGHAIILEPGWREALDVVEEFLRQFHGPMGAIPMALPASAGQRFTLPHPGP